MMVGPGGGEENTGLGSMSGEAKKKNELATIEMYSRRSNSQV